MKKIRIKGVEEDIFYEKLDNGLEVYLYTKDTIHSNYVTFTTKYGSVYNEFVPINSDKMTTFPKGIAHFLEHKVFAEKEDPQPMEFFARSGAVCNAYTTFKNTTYLFYATESLKENIEYLLDYVQNIYLTDESVENEKDIISEEIHMYDDRPMSILEEKVRKNTLKTNPYKDSIIGTTKDIRSITKEDLETFLKNKQVLNGYNAFSQQVMKEFIYLFEQYEIAPKLFLSYERLALKGKEDPTLRMTFYRNILTRRDDFDFDKEGGDALLNSHQIIMEIKFENAMPLWLAHLLASHQIYKTSFSKYGHEYQKYVMKKRSCRV